MRSRDEQRLPHALLLYGPEGSGKASLAHALANTLLCKQPTDSGTACGQCSRCQLIRANTHPDLTVLVPTPPEKTKSKKPVLHIRIDVIRALCDKLAVSSQMLGRRIAIIENAERMMPAAANALLKTLEEPGEDTLIILVSSNPHRLPVTIRSRCQSINCPNPGLAEGLNWLQQQGVKQAETALSLAHGAPLVAIHYEEEHLQYRELLSKALLATSRGESSLSYAQKLTNLPKDKGFVWLQDWVIDLIRLKRSQNGINLVNEDYRESLQKLATRSDTRRVFAFYDQICSYIRQDGIALNPQLVWENLLISWDSL